MSLSLACDGLPNCGENIIPNADEACFKVRTLWDMRSAQFWPLSSADPLVLRAAQPGVLHPAGHHDAPLHVLLRSDPHPVVGEVLHGGDEVPLRQVLLEVLLSLWRELQSSLGPATSHLRRESEAHEPWPPAAASGPSALPGVLHGEVPVVQVPAGPEDVQPDGRQQHATSSIHQLWGRGRQAGQSASTMDSIS